MAFRNATEWYAATFCAPNHHDHGEAGLRSCMLETVAGLQSIGKVEKKPQAPPKEAG